MDTISINRISTLVAGESTIIVARLNQTPPVHWAETFERSTVTAVFGHYPHLDDDTISVTSESVDATSGTFAAHEAVNLTNALVADHERLTLAWAVGAALCAGA